MRENRNKWNESTLTLPAIIRQAVPRKLFLDIEHKLLICLVPKTGVTSYNSMLIQYSSNFIKEYPNKTAFEVYGYGIYYKRAKHGIIAAQSLSPSQLFDALENYHKIMTTRHPFLRLYSFYKDKIAGSDCNKMMGAPHRIIEYTRKIKLEHKRDACAMNITFDEFITFFRAHREYDHNYHLKRINKVCSPCVIQYDTFMRTETASADQEYIVKNYLADVRKETPSVTSFKTNVHSEPNAGFTQQLRGFSNLTNNDIEWLQSFYSEDLRLFGYNVDNKASKIVANCEIEINSDKCC